MTSNICALAILFTAIFFGASSAIARDKELSNEPGLVFMPQAKADDAKASPSSSPRAKRKIGAPTDGRAKPLSNGGASTSETFGDWSVACGSNGGVKFCTLAQTQINKGTGQRAFAIELRPSTDGSNQGTILTPFGLKLDAGIILKVDSEAQKLRFSTCLAEGCLIPLVIPSAAMEEIRKAKTFTVDALSMNDQTVTFNVSLNGFGAALDRAGRPPG